MKVGTHLKILKLFLDYFKSKEDYILICRIILISEQKEVRREKGEKIHGIIMLIFPTKFWMAIFHEALEIPVV